MAVYATASYLNMYTFHFDDINKTLRKTRISLVQGAQLTRACIC